MNNFEELKIEMSYRSDVNNIYVDFYQKCINYAVKYDRAVGYFTSGSLELLAESLLNIIKKNGKIRIVTSPNLEKEDIMAIANGKELNKIYKSLEEEWNLLKKRIIKDKLLLLSWMISKELLEIKVAFSKEKNLLYHEKFGIFTDEKGNKISFSGSVNETIGGMKTNFESIDVYSSLNKGNDEKRIVRKEYEFEKLWNNETNKIQVINLHDAIKKDILNLTKNLNDEDIKKILDKLIKKEEIKFPEYLKIRDYQLEAAKCWIENNKLGILEMATGTGKTITALNIIKEILKNEKVAIVIVCPQNFLVLQWENEILDFGINSIVCNSENNRWKELLDGKIFKFNKNIINTFITITTTKTLQNKSFLRALARIEKKKMIIVDECHNLGSQSFKNFLKNKSIKNIEYRLGLSATPNRENDLEGNKIINNYLGDVIYRYTLKDAIDAEYLTRYKYIPHFITLTEKEEKEYEELSRKIFKLSMIRNDLKEKKESLEILLFKRSRLLNTALNKKIRLEEIIDKNSYNNLIYVGGGKKGDERNIELILEYLCSKGIKSKKITSDENKEERIEIVKEFVEKKIQAIVAIKCLDEGINIPSIEKAYILASTSNYKEYVQRRGRVLRKSYGKIIAEIHDFVVIPRHFKKYNCPSEYNFKIEKSLVKSELRRVEEYNLLAENKNRNILKINELIQKYEINKEGEENE